MITGHLVTALVADRQLKGENLLFFLVCSIFPDLLWVTFHYLGLEPTGPSDILSVTLSNLMVNMVYSHDLLPQLVWLPLVFLIGRLLFARNDIAVMGAALVFCHFLFDLLAGYPHHVYGTDSPSIGLALYYNNVILALVIEAAIVVALLAYILSSERKAGISRTMANYFGLCGVFMFGLAFFFMIANRTLRDTFGIPDFYLEINTTMLSMIITFFGLVYAVYSFGNKTNLKRT